jgi:uncharacterized protein (TIGR00730 family)
VQSLNSISPPDDQGAASRPRRVFVRRFKDPALILKELQQLISRQGEYSEAGLLLQMVDTVLKMVRDGASRGDLKMLGHALRELRYAFKVFAPYRRIRKVSIFGSARTLAGDPEYVQASAFANRMTRLGYMVITGAGSGIMESAQGGAGKERSFGVNIRLPFEQKANRVIENDPKLIHFKYFFTRKVIFLKETDAVAIFPGGFGTHDEAFESLTLVQTGKSDLLPIVFLDRSGGSYWKEWEEYLIKHLKVRGYIDPQDLSLFKVTDSLDEAARAITDFYSNYHSMRFVRDRLLLRLQRAVSGEQLEHLNAHFADLLASGSFESLDGPLPEEEDDPHTHGLFRLAFHFDRRSYGRLRQMVDYLNQA